MKKISLIFAIFPLLMTSCFQLDNYDAPDAGIDGTLIDIETGSPVYTEQPDGCRIELMDLSYENPTPLQFWAKADGTFRNVALFSGDYDVTPGSAEVTVKYTIRRSTTPEGMTIGQKTISESRLLCNIYPVVSCYNSCYIEENSTTKVLSRSTDASIESRVYEDPVKNLKSGQKYYIRVAALSSCSYNSTLKRYNYTPVIEIVAP